MRDAVFSAKFSIIKQQHGEYHKRVRGIGGYRVLTCEASCFSVFRFIKVVYKIKKFLLAQISTESYNFNIINGLRCDRNWYLTVLNFY